MLVAGLCLGCAPGPQGLAPTAWNSASGEPGRAPDCSGLESPGSTSRVGERLEPGPGRPLRRPAELGAGPVRRLWASTLGGTELEWVAPVGEDVQRLWLLRVVPTGRCVVGTWGSPGIRTEVVKHGFTSDGRREVVLLGLGHPPERLWMALGTDGAQLWSALESSTQAQAAVQGDDAELRDKDGRLLLVTISGSRVGVLQFDGERFRPRP